MKDIVIVGTSGFAREIEQLVHDVNAKEPTWRLVGFLDDDREKHGNTVHGLPILGGVAWTASNPTIGTVVAIGAPASRRRVVRALGEAGSPEFPLLVHPSAVVGRHVRIGPGSIVCAGTTLTTDISIGAHVIMNLHCTNGHDVIVEDFVTMAPGVNISGNVTIEEGSDLGTNSAVTQGQKIGRWSVLGAGTVVVRDVEANVTAVGVPARTIQRREAGWEL